MRDGEAASVDERPSRSPGRLRSTVRQRDSRRRLRSARTSRHREGVRRDERRHSAHLHLGRGGRPLQVHLQVGVVVVRRLLGPVL